MIVYRVEAPGLTNSCWPTGQGRLSSEVWIDLEHRIREVRTTVISTQCPGRTTRREGTSTTDLRITAYGVPVTVVPPPNVGRGAEAPLGPSCVRKRGKA